MTKIKIDLTKPGSRDVNVTPALATEWLELNVKNRNEKKGRIPQYVRDMLSDNWRYTGEPIKFNNLGHLVDGQNRLQAVVISGTTQRFLVVTGLEEDAQEVMDTGSPRTVGDALTMEKNGIPGVVKPLRGKQNTDSGLLYPSPREYKRKDTIARNEKLKAAQDKASPLGALTPFGDRSGQATIQSSRDYAASQHEAKKPKKGKKQELPSLGGGGSSSHLPHLADGSATGLPDLR